MRISILVLVAATVACSAAAPPFRFDAVYRCGPQTTLEAWTSGDTLRLASVGRTYRLERRASARGARWQGEDVVFHEKGETATFVRGGERRECRLDESLVQAIERGVDYRALGQEPGWLLDILDGERIVLKYDYAQRTATLPYAEPVEKQGARVLVATRGEERIEVRITGADCRDAMSGQPYPDTVSVNYRNARIERTLEGCGRPLPK